MRSGKATRPVPQPVADEIASRASHVHRRLQCDVTAAAATAVTATVEARSTTRCSFPILQQLPQFLDLLWSSLWISRLRSPNKMAESKHPSLFPPSVSSFLCVYVFECLSVCVCVCVCLSVCQCLSKSHILFLILFLSVFIHIFLPPLITHTKVRFRTIKLHYIYSMKTRTLKELKIGN